MYGNIIGYYTNMKPNLQIVILNGKTTGSEKGSPKLKKKCNIICSKSFSYMEWRSFIRNIN